MNARAALIQLGKVVARDMGSGRIAEGSRMAVEAVAAIPDATASLVDLAASEAGKKRPNQGLVAAYAFMIGTTLELLRFGTERADPAAAAAVAAVRGRLLALARSGELDPSLLLLLLRQFAVAKLDVGEELRDLIGAALAGDAGTARNAADHGSDAEYFEGLAREFGGDAFAIYSELSESGSALPDEHRIAMAYAVSRASPAPVRDAALGWLLDPSRQVRVGTARALAEAAGEGLVTGATGRRLIMARNWLPDADRQEVDAAIKAARRSGVQPDSKAAAQLRGVVASGFDGAGAQSVFVIVKSGRKHALASLLLKQDIGVRDAWVRRDLSKAEVQDFVRSVEREIGAYDASLDYVRLALPHFLSLNQASGVLPPFGALDFIETVGLEVANPEAVSVEQLTARVLDTNRLNGTPDAEEVLAASREWPDTYEFMQLWFEDDARVDEVLARKRLTKAKRVDLVLEQIVEPRRRRWAELLAWSALVLEEAGDQGEAADFAVVARELVGKLPLSDISLMQRIATTSVEAWKARLG